MSLHDICTSDYGDFVDSDTDDYDEVEFYAEPLQRYREFLYYPICIGEVLVQRYRIVHKLGHGGFSTVWMAHDIHEKRDVALKILISGQDGSYEQLMQNKIIQAVQDTSHLITYQATFYLPGHEGTQHQVLVFPLRGPNLVTCLREKSLATRMSAARQLLVALKGLHDARIVHRDLNKAAVMWDIISLDQYDTAIKYQYLGRPKKVDLSWLPWKPGELVRPMKVPQNMIGEKVYLGDFGMAIQAGTSVNCKPQSPAIFCAPERYHNIDPSCASDMWSYMCIFVSLYFGCEAFYGSGGKHTMSVWVNSLGPLPEQWKGYYSYYDSKSDDAWYDQSREPQPLMTLASNFERMRPEVNETERNLALEVFAKAFCYVPEYRITAAQLLEDASFKALLKIYGC
ncbi:uncharacterized protein BP5553_10424 [Venustampulla echinocandica]|uniref:Protein kinase domain-containing protein n=1 Tax=Venustampulla echinocandica TaxID=2656787 RepID=A0A370T998_9HELO|nr:uncharacterized protein BP5553_10424 [Venustampulla echinocandica]RDL30146.1 hypothetical protein BP5553_10424 [Venustampulla echinocandica]